MLYEGLTGRLPFIAGDRTALFDEILHRDPKPLRQIDDSIPRELERICLRCLCKRMPDRYSSSIDLADDLRAWLAAAASPAAGPDGPPTAGSPAKMRRQTRPRSSPRAYGLSTSKTPMPSWTCCPDRAVVTDCRSRSASGRPESRTATATRPSASASCTAPRGVASHR